MKGKIKDNFEAHATNRRRNWKLCGIDPGSDLEKGPVKSVGRAIS